MGVVSRYMEDTFGKWHVQCTSILNKDTTLSIVDSTSLSDIILLLEIPMPIQHNIIILL